MSTRWVASGFLTLVKYFNIVSSDDTRDKNEKSTFSGLLKEITSTSVVQDLVVMCDALQELIELSLYLQNRDISLMSANQIIENVVQIFA